MAFRELRPKLVLWIYANSLLGRNSGKNLLCSYQNLSTLQFDLRHYLSLFSKIPVWKLQFLIILLPRDFFSIKNIRKKAVLHLQPKTPHSLSPLPPWATIYYLIFHLPFQEEFVYEGDHRKAASQMSSRFQSSPFLTICGPYHSLIYHHPGGKNPYFLLLITTLLAWPAELVRA